MNTKEKIAVMQAYEDGKEIEYRFTDSMERHPWRPIRDPTWDWSACEYRVKPNEPRVVWGRAPSASNLIVRTSAHESTIDAEVAKLGGKKIMFLEVIQE